MGQVGAAGDNAAMESFFAAAEERPQPAPLEQPARAANRDHHLDRTHLSPPRRQTRLGRLTPIQYETTMTKPQALAA